MWKQPIFKTRAPCYNDACLRNGRESMFYTTEEAAIVCGFLNLYLDRASVDANLRKRNTAFQRSAALETLKPEDYRWAENVLCFLKPCWWQLHEDHAVRFSFSLSAPLYRGRIHHPENRSRLRTNRNELQVAGHKLLCFQSSFGCLDGICSLPLIQGYS